MSHCRGKAAPGVAVAEIVEDAHRSWWFCYAAGRRPRFWITARQGGRTVTWPDIGHDVTVGEDLNALPDGIAAWVTRLTGGRVPAWIADAAAVRIGHWLACRRRLPRAHWNAQQT